MDDYLKTDMTEFGLTLKSINPSAEWIAIPPEVKWVDADCSMKNGKSQADKKSSAGQMSRF